MCIVTFSNDDLLGFFYLDFGGFHLFLLYGNLPLSLYRKCIGDLGGACWTLSIF